MRDDNVDMIDESKHIKNRLIEFFKLLEKFRHQYNEVVTDETLRFEFLCEKMFGTFVFQDGEPIIFSNLDTGDALSPPFPPFIKAFQTEAGKAEFDAQRYYQPGCIPSLKEATLSFLEKEGFNNGQRLPNIEVLPGTGTVQIYDALCRVHVEKPDDTVLVPELGYGYFLTQPCRVFGRVATVACDKIGAVTHENLAMTIEQENKTLWENWKANSDFLFKNSVRKLIDSDFANIDFANEGIFNKIYDELSKSPDAWRSDQFSKLIESAAPELSSIKLRNRVIKILRPPRVVSYLHIQPSVTGHIYTADQIKNISDVLFRNQVVAFEDIAYHSIRCRLAELALLQGSGAVTYTLFGLSKPMAIANLRLGLMIVEKEHYERVNRALESTTGYVSSLLQRALLKTLHSDEFSDYVIKYSYEYETRYKFMHRFLTGEPSEIDELAHEVVNSVIKHYCNLSPFVNDFLKYGLKRWLKPIAHPTAGFFNVISCKPLLNMEIFKQLGITSSLDVFALLAYMFDLRSIPEEAMRPAGKYGFRLRFAFSPNPEVVALLFLRTFAGLRIIESTFKKTGI